MAPLVLDGGLDEPPSGLFGDLGGTALRRSSSCGLRWLWRSGVVQALDRVALASSEQSVSVVSVCVSSSAGGLSDGELRRDSGGHGPALLARSLHFKMRGEWHYHLRQISKSLKQGGGAAAQKADRTKRRPKTARRWGSRGDSPLSVDASPRHPGRTKEGFQGPVSAISDFHIRNQSTRSETSTTDKPCLATIKNVAS